jgi:ring-1,2-phenylacetyl-CoA epoxidase subunit PaaC
MPLQPGADYLLQLADNALVLGQRNAEWCGHGPVLEEDIAMANIGLDLIGQARLLYQHAAALIGEDCTEDRLAYFRDAGEFRNYCLLELPHHGPLAANAQADRDYATTIVRNFLYSQWMLLLWEALQRSSDSQLAAIAAKSVKEVRYHLRHSSDWLVRLGDGTAQSHARAQAALDHLLPYTEEFWSECATEQAASASGLCAEMNSLRADWDAAVDETLAEATLHRPAPTAGLPQGKRGQHTEHLSYLLAELQGLARAHPQATW